MKSSVSIVRCGSYEQEKLFPRIKEAFSLLGGLSAFIKPNSKVLVKPNLLMAVKPEANITTHPEFVRGVIRVLKELDCRIFLGDGPSVFGGYIEEVIKVYEITGMKRITEEEGVELVFFDKRFMQGYFPLTEWVRECDYVVNVPKFKTHEFTILTGAVKNLFGLIPGTFKMELHKNFSQVKDFAGMLLDIYQAVKPAVSIIDGISGMEGNGPATSGAGRNFNLILASQDSIALDCVLAALMNVKPLDIFTNYEAKQRKIGNTDLSNIEIKGEPLFSCRIKNFKLPDTSLQQLVRRMMPAPLAYLLKKLIFFRPIIDTDLCRLCESCLKACPQKTIFLKQGKIQIDYSRCISCFCCREVCPYKAVRMKKSFLAKILKVG